MKNVTRKGFSLRPYAVTTPDGEVVDLDDVMSLLVKDVHNAQALMQWEIDNHGQEIIDRLDEVEGLPVNAAAARLGLTSPDWVKDDLASGRAGRSRYVEMVYGEVVASCRAWRDRCLVTTGTSKKYVSAGYKRTARNTKPTMPYRLNTGYSTGGRYARWEMSGSLRLVVDGTWYVFHFAVPERYRKVDRIGLPTIQLVSNKVDFHFAVETEYQQRDISTRYIVGVDVGKNQYSTVVVWHAQNKSIVHQTTLSQRVHSLWNSIRASERQVRFLHQKGRVKESVLHRSANIRKKRELAILVGQEIADIAYAWDNAVVSVEDLSWVKNTMQNGRWNRGELIKWVTHYVEQNGSRVVRVNANGTSQRCYGCNNKVVHVIYREVACDRCNTRIDRDVNAGANIARQAVKPAVKMTTTRKKSKSYRPGKAEKLTPTTQNTLKYLGRDRTKTSPTPKKPKNRKGVGHLRPLTACTTPSRVVRDSETTTTLGPEFGVSHVPVRVKRE